jgi:hypothetical protein
VGIALRRIEKESDTSVPDEIADSIEREIHKNGEPVQPRRPILTRSVHGPGVAGWKPYMRRINLGRVAI